MFMKSTRGVLPASILPAQPVRYCWCQSPKEWNEVHFQKYFRRVHESQLENYYLKVFS